MSILHPETFRFLRRRHRFAHFMRAALHPCCVNALKRCRREVSVNVQEIVYGLLLSKYGDENRVQEVFAQNWVPDWDGWLQGKDADTDEDYMQLMTRFEAVAKANVPVNVKSNRARLAELETQGLTLIVASPHGANNCLIDSLLLGLIRSGILTCSGDILQRQHVCEACRAYLKTEHGIEEGIYLDGHRDGPRILYYLLAIRWPRAVVLQVRFYDRLDQNDFSEELREELNSIEFSWGPLLQRVRCELHIFNHTHSDGNGYHFDLLWRSHAGGRDLTERSDGQTPSEQRIDDSPRSRDGAAPWPATTARQEGPIDTAPKLAENNQPQVNRSASSKRSFDIGSALQMQLSDPVSPDNTCGRLVEKAPAAENFDHMDAAASAGDGPDGGPPVTDLYAAPTTSPKRDHTVASADARTMLGGDDLRACLQNFLSARSQAPIRIEESDVNSLRAKWNNMADVGAQLQVWLGASMPNFEPTRKNALLLAKQWMRFYIACTQEIESKKKNPSPQGDSHGTASVDAATLPTTRNEEATDCARKKQRIDDSPRSRDGAAPWPATTARQEGPIDTAPKLAENNQPQVNRSASSKRSFDIGSALQMQLSDPVSPDNTCGRHVEKAPAAENFDQMAAAASAGDGPDGGPPVTDLYAAPTTSPKRDHTVASADARTMLGGDDLRACLQNFLSARSQAPIRIEESDVNSLRAKWNNMADVGAQLQVWLGASMPNFEPTRKNALLLAKQWMRFYIACTQEIESKKKNPSPQGDSHGTASVDAATLPTTRNEEATDCARKKRPALATSSPKQKAAKREAPTSVPLRAGGRGKGTSSQEVHNQANEILTSVDGKNMLRHRNPAPKRRYTKKAPQDMEDAVENVESLEQDEYSLATWACAHGNPDPRAEKEAAISRLAKLLRPVPALPHGMKTSDPAFDVPNWHCAFQDCRFEAETYAELTDHILHQHVTALKQVTDLKLPPLAWEEAGMEAYRAAISCVCQDAAPLAHSAIDRRCLRQFQAAKDGDNIGAAICFVCGQRFPYVDTQEHTHGNRIQWRRLVHAKTDEFLNLPRAQAEEWFGYDAYWRKYAAQHEPDAQAQLEDELQEWQTTIQFIAGAPLRVICCPEDKVCRRRCPPDTSCPMCRAPVCQFCWNGVTKEKVLPATALANDMLVFYAPKMIYQQEVTFMELICASPCFTAMCCFSLEKRLLSDRALDQDAFMPRQRLAARGNATTFPLAWEDILQHLEAAEAGSLSLPRTGVELAETVSVVLKTMQANSDAEGLGKVIHQARVRRAVVLQLLQEAKTRGHPAYKRINMLEASTRAQTLPEDGIPDEIIAILPYDDDLANVQRQKAATPVRENLTLEAVAEELGEMCKPNAVVNEKSSGGIGDTNAQQVAALEALQRGANAGAGNSVLTVTTGNRLLDQFQPWYFAFAFAYVFPFCTAMPDPPAWQAKPRYRRGEGTPRIELEAWVRCMARRCEAQINRDWVFGFVSWNLLFRSAVNLSRTVHTYGTPVYDERTNKFRTLTARDIEAGAVQLVRALNSQYIDSTGKPRPVNGDMTKLPYVQNLSPAARKLLKNMQHTARQLPGTQEARRQMRFEIEAMRIRYGVPLFVTFSPDESHQLVYIRMSRTRRSDPVRSASVWQEWQCGEREFPPLDDNRTLPIAVEAVQRLVPCWEQRRRVLARDPLASVDGFHTLALLLLKYIFGLHMCPHCPNCATTWHPCTDIAGSNATVVGGVFGRVDAAYVSIEAQKSTGSLHAHCQVFVQCLHQHTPLTEIFQLVESRLDSLRSTYLQYSTHVVHMTYAGQAEEQIVDGVDAAEQTWPEHAMDRAMTACPEYLRARTPTRDVSEAHQWARTYLEDDVVTLQYLKQHHYHPIDPETGERKPLRGCEKKDRPGVCKSDFPRIAWLCAEAKVLCPCELTKHGFPDHGRKNRLGALFGPCGHCWLNGCHPALLAALRGGNVDVQVPYRLPFACGTCGKQLTRRQRQEIALAAQRAQDAQTGYCCDYCAKNQPMGTHEIKEFQKGHVLLNARLQDQPLEQVGKRHMGRLMSDAYGRGIVRGQVEGCNLRANHKLGQTVAAERISTTGFVALPGHAYIATVKSLHGEGTEEPRARKYMRTKPTGAGAQHLREVDIVRAYGHRPSGTECWWLSPYEFTMYWALVPTRVPQTRREWEDEDPVTWDVTLTSAGKQRLQKHSPSKLAKLRPQRDYTIRLANTRDRYLFPATPGNATLRHAWYLLRRTRPLCPHFAQAAVPRRFAENVEDNAMLARVYFGAWTLDQSRSSTAVPYVGHLCQAGETWEAALRRWAQRLPCEESKRHLGNFLSVYRIRPPAEAQENSDDSDADEELALSLDDLPTALQTLEPNQAEQNKQSQAVISATGFKLANAMWPPLKRLEGPRSEQATGYETIDIPKLKQALRHNDPPEAKGPTDPSNKENLLTHATAQMAMPGVTPESVEGWAAQLPPSDCNPEQKKFCRKVAERIAAELRMELRSDEASSNDEPLRWVLHGGPGTGKSYTLNLLRHGLFEKVLGWKQGVQYQVVTFQAVMADALEGDTIHHAFGLNWTGNDSNKSLKHLLELSLATLQWRWLIIDEFSMVSAELLAQLERRCREMMRDLSVAKYGYFSGEMRPFGGLNVILAGDLFQLPPPRGTFVGDIPWQMLVGRPTATSALATQGQTLIWGGKTVGLQGVTELTRCERTADRWLASVQEELRYGTLSQDTHAFLHGQPTTKPGSWCNGELTCGNTTCMRLLGSQTKPQQILDDECAVCASERVSRRLVAATPDDPRFGETFQSAMSIFSTNDLKYHVNKVRAMQWADAAPVPLHYAIARDMASSTVLQEKPEVQRSKIEWLQRHDQECGGLYGILPICLSLPVRAIEHLDRRRGILKGCKGKIIGWSTAPDTQIWNKLPEVIYVQFETVKTWRIDGLLHDNVFPVTAQRKPWFLDRGRKSPRLRITRLQFPLAPGFAITAHVAQGQTLRDGVIADFNISPVASVFTTYVAATRVTGRDKLLIMRPFPASPFQKGNSIGRELLLRVWRGDHVDWEALRAKYLEERMCSECGENKGKAVFTVGQWKRGDAERVCRECAARHRDAGEPYQCNVCRSWFSQEAFATKHRRNESTCYRVCCACEVQKPCHRCKVKKPMTEYTASAWKARHTERRICKACTKKGNWTCASCHRALVHMGFSAWLRHRPSGQNGTQICDECYRAKRWTCITAQGRRRLQKRRTTLRRREILQEVRAEVESRVRARRTVTGMEKESKPNMTQFQLCSIETKTSENANNRKRKSPAAGSETRSNGTSADATKEMLCVPKPRQDEGSSDISQRSEDPRAAEATTWQKYQCPYCQASTESTIKNGKVNVAGHCGKQFRVSNGQVARGNTHACPLCGTKVQSARAYGQIKCNHTKPNGKACPTTRWYVKR